MYAAERCGIDMQSLNVRYHGELITLKDACSRAGVSVSAVYFARRRYSLELQEAFEFTLSRSRENEWTADRVHILRENFMLKGADIPSLLKYFSIKEIKNKAAELELRGPNNPDVVFEDKTIPYVNALALMGVSESTAKDYRTEFGWTPQQVVNKLSRCHLRLSDGRYLRTTKFFCRGEEDYIHAEGKLWDAATFCKYHASPESSLLANLRNNHGMTLREAYEYWCNHREEIEQGPTAISVSLRSSALKPVYSAYIGTDNLKYYFARCTSCGAILLLSAKQVVEFRHGELCTTMLVPSCVRIPTRFTWDIEKGNYAV